MSYALIIEAKDGNTYVDTFDSPYTMSRAHQAYTACDINVIPTIDGERVYAYMNASGVRTYYKANKKG